MAQVIVDRARVVAIVGERESDRTISSQRWAAKPLRPFRLITHRSNSVGQTTQRIASQLPVRVERQRRVEIPRDHQ
jgi:hypothetical protein